MANESNHKILRWRGTILTKGGGSLTYDRDCCCGCFAEGIVFLHAWATSLPYGPNGDQVSDFIAAIQAHDWPCDFEPRVAWVNWLGATDGDGTIFLGCADGGVAFYGCECSPSEVGLGVLYDTFEQNWWGRVTKYDEIGTNNDDPTKTIEEIIASRYCSCAGAGDPDNFTMLLNTGIKNCCGKTGISFDLPLRGDCT